MLACKILCIDARYICNLPIKTHRCAPSRAAVTGRTHPPATLHTRKAPQTSHTHTRPQHRPPWTQDKPGGTVSTLNTHTVRHVLRHCSLTRPNTRHIPELRARFAAVALPKRNRTRYHHRECMHAPANKARHPTHSTPHADTDTDARARLRAHHTYHLGAASAATCDSLPANGCGGRSFTTETLHTFTPLSCPPAR